MVGREASGSASALPRGAAEDRAAALRTRRSMVQDMASCTRPHVPRRRLGAGVSQIWGRILVTVCTIELVKGTAEHRMKAAWSAQPPPEPDNSSLVATTLSEAKL